MKIVYCSDLHVDITQNNAKLVPFIIILFNSCITIERLKKVKSE